LDEVATRAASQPTTAARGTSDRKSQKLISAASPNVRACATPESIDSAHRVACRQSRLSFIGPRRAE
jgi:hypothetical protein